MIQMRVITVVLDMNPKDRNRPSKIVVWQPPKS